MLKACYDVERARIFALEGTIACDNAHPVFGEGNTTSPHIMLIGEAPGRDEAACGRPFVGAAGKQLDRMLLTAAIARSDVFVTNTVKYRPVKQSRRGFSNRTPSIAEVKAALPTLCNEIGIVQPHIIATLGNVPLMAALMLAGEGRETVGDTHGTPRTVAIAGRAYVLFPLYHPAAAIYNRELAPILERDLAALGSFARSTV